MRLKLHQIRTKHEIYRIIPILIARCVKRALHIRTFRTGIIAARIRRNYFDLTSKVDDVQRRFLCNGISNYAIRHEKSSRSDSGVTGVAYRVLNFSLRSDQLT